MNRRLAKAVVAAFHDENPDTLRGRFAPFGEREWSRSMQWLHTSGLALYFLARAKALGIEDVMPAEILNGLDKNLVQNRERTEDLFNEFVKINMEFQRAKLSYANLKGFALIPLSCPDPAFRYQHDLDFLVSRSDAERCTQALERQGYRLDRVYGDTWEFKAGSAEVSSLRDLYKTRLNRSVDVRFLPEKEDDELLREDNMLSRLQLQLWNGFEFPALSESDKLLGQALHLFKHFNTAWTRTAWMLEYATAIRAHRDNEALWREVIAGIETTPEKKVGVGIASLIVSRAFGVSLPTQLRSTVDELPERVGLWVERYQDDVVFQEHPGSKLYLLLQDVLSQERSGLSGRGRRRLFPSHLPPRITTARRSDGLRLGTQVLWAQTTFIVNRLRFHVAEGLRYKIEAARWKKFVAGLSSRIGYRVQ
jgi:hypothetical protein